MPIVQLGSGARHKYLSFETSTVVSLVLFGVLFPCPLRARKLSLALTQGHTISREVSSSHFAKWASPWGNAQTVCMCLHTCSKVYTKMRGEFSLKEELMEKCNLFLMVLYNLTNVFTCVYTRVHTNMWRGMHARGYAFKWKPKDNLEYCLSDAGHTLPLPVASLAWNSQTTLRPICH